MTRETFLAGLGGMFDAEYDEASSLPVKDWSYVDGRVRVTAEGERGPTHPGDVFVVSVVKLERVETPGPEWVSPGEGRSW
jgi:hypothetical protein